MSEAIERGSSRTDPKRASNRVRAGLPLSLLAAFVALGCSAAAPNPVTRHEHVVSGSVELHAERYRALGYDPNDPRLLRVTAELEKLYGRPIVVRFASEMMPRGQWYFESLFDSELGKLPQEMQAWKRHHGDAFAQMMAALVHIDFDYDGSLPEPISEFGKEPGRLRFVLNSWRIPEELVQRAMHGAYRRWQAARFLERAPEEIPSNERRAYLDALTQQGATYFFVAARQKAQAPSAPNEQSASNAHPESDAPSEPSAGHSEVMLRTLRLAAVAGDQDAALTLALTERLLLDGRYLRRCYLHHPNFVRAADPESVWGNAERQWMRWALGGLRTLPAEQRYELLDLMLVPAQSSPRLAQHERAFPGFDVVDFGLDLLDDWAAAGHPTAGGGRAEDAPDVHFYDRLLCPMLPDERGFLRRRASNCRPSLYATALGDESDRQRLLNAIVSAKEAPIRTLLSANLVELTRSTSGMPKGSVVPSVLELLRRLEPHRAQWRELVRLLAIEIEASTELREALYDLTTRYYRDRPADRGVLLFLLARIDGHGRTPVAWQQFGPTYGAAVTTGELEVFLDQSHLAFEKLRALMPALDPRVSPGSVAATKLRQYLDSPWAGRELQARGRVVATFANELARTTDREGLQRLYQELRAYVGSDPGRERQLRDTSEELQALIQRTGPG